MASLTYFVPEYYAEDVLDKIQQYKFITKTTDFSIPKRTVEKKIIRDVELTYLGRRKELFVFHVLTTKVAITSNRTVMNERLLKEDIFAFGILVIGVEETGEIVKMYNLNEMQDRWHKKQLQLRKDYSGYEFDHFVNEISNVLKNEEKTLFFLNSHNMFGLYFCGWFNEKDVKVAKKRSAAILEFDDVTVSEAIRTNKKETGFSIEGNTLDNEKEVIKKYEGELIYDKNNQLLDGFLEIENESINIKHSLVWVG